MRLDFDKKQETEWVTHLIKLYGKFNTENHLFDFLRL